uniref:Uncharacterized protein n=1 Tax=Mycena chlorophos TaxID=658473 RepID=A0ABQ0LVW5_MYCCL|nr:predicted protein [Mycena chlorophos]
MSYADHPAAGERIILNTAERVTDYDLERFGGIHFHNLGGEPMFVGSAVFTHDDGRIKSVHPCKIGPHLHPHVCSVAYGGEEISHRGRYDLLVINDEKMEWVPTGHGRVPEGRIPVDGGHEEDGKKLFHARARLHNHNNVGVPGKTGHHLGSAHVSFGGEEIEVREHYDIL